MTPHSLEKLAEEIAKRTAGNVAEYLGPDLEAQMGIYLAKDIVELARSVRREALEEAAKLAETITFKVQDPITKGILKEPRTIKPLWGEDTAKAIRELLDKESI